MRTSNLHLIRLAILAVSIFLTLPAEPACFTEYATLAESPVQKLFDHINGRWADTLKHELTLRDDGAHLKIGSLTLEDSAFLRLLARVVKDGRLAELEGGRIIGPKAMNFLAHLQEMSPPQRAVRFSGSVSPKALYEAQSQQLSAMRRMKDGVQVDPASVWTDADIEKFEQALVKFKVEEACVRLWKTNDLRLCRNMKFEFIGGDLEHIVWTRAQ